MAGIGFRLQALVGKGSYLESTTAYLSAAVISSGPWLAGVIALMALGSTSSVYLSKDDRSLLFATIITVFAASLLVAGGPQMLVTRYLADQLYLKDTSSVAPTCTGTLFLVIPFAVLALPFLLFAPFDMRYRFLTSTLFLTLTMTWMVTIFLSTAREYTRIVIIFTSSYALAVIASLGLGCLYGLLGSLSGFTLGQLFCLCLLIVNVYREFPSSQGVSLAYLGYVRKYWILLLIGGMYALGVWADSILFWFSSNGESIGGFYHLCPPYDTTKFLVCLSTIPAVVIFMVHLETNFDRHYQQYYRLIQNKGTLADLVRAREGMMAALRAGSGTILKIQGILALLLCLLARDVTMALGISSQWIQLFRFETLASVAQFFVFIAMLLLLYIDRRRAALLVLSVFLLCNLVLTQASLYLGNSMLYGLGYLGASLIGAIVGWLLLNRQLKRLEYLTFMGQPVGTDA